MTVGLVLVSHSAAIADGLRELAGQMAPAVSIVAAGGGPDGELGTSFDRVSTALAAADSGAGVVVLYDLGSALLTAESARELLDPVAAERAIVVDAPLVEGAVAAAVAAQTGADLPATAAAARAAASPHTAGPPNPGAHRRTATVGNRLGLHARPAAELARATDGTDVVITTAKGRSARVRDVLAVLTLGVSGGEEVTLRSDDAARLDLLHQMIQSGFGEDLIAGESVSPETAG